MTINTISDKFITYDPRLIPQAPPLGTPLDTSGEYTIMLTSAAWKAHITGVVMRLTELSAWVGSDNDVQNAIDNIHLWLSQEGNMVFCEHVMDCVDASATILNINNSIIDVNTSTSNANYIDKGKGNLTRTDKYTGYPISIHPNAPLAMNTNTQDSIDRLCYAIDFFVREYAESKKAVLNLAIFGSYLNVGLTALLASSLGGLGFIVGGSAITAEVFAIALLQEALDALSDDTAITDVICCIQEYLNLRPLNLTTFTLGLDDNCHVALTHADIARQLLAEDRGNTDGYLYFIECLARLQSISGIVDCLCVTPITCTGITQVTYPVAPTYYTIPSSEILMSSGVTITTVNFGYNTYSMTQGQYLDIYLPDNQCINKVYYTSREGASGSGSVTWNMFVNGVQTGSAIDAHLVVGAIETQTKPIFNAGSGSERGTVLRLQIPVNVAMTRPIQITNIRLGYLV